jgi:hypothetical protein
MNIAFFTEMGFQGKIPRSHSNMRTEFAWMHALNADHFYLHNNLRVRDYDHVFIIFPKGQLYVNADGTFSYTHNGSATSEDSFTFRAYDGFEYSNTATISITIRTPSQGSGGMNITTTLDGEEVNMVEMSGNGSSVYLIYINSNDELMFKTKVKSINEDTLLISTNSIIN